MSHSFRSVFKKNPSPLLRALSPAERGVPAADLSGLPGSLRRLQPPTGLHFLQAAGGKSTAHRRRLEGQGIRHPCEGSEAVWLLLGLQCCTFITSLLFLLAAAENSMVPTHLFYFILFFLDRLPGGSDLQEDQQAGVPERAAAGGLLQQLRQLRLQRRPDGQRLQVRPDQRRHRHRGVLPL